MQKMTEFQFQCAIKDFCDLYQLPMIHVPNAGLRSKFSGHMLQRSGMVAGVSDVFIMRPNAHYSGLWLELKIKPNKPTPAQLRFLELVKQEGYWGEICYELDATLRLISIFYGI